MLAISDVSIAKVCNDVKSFNGFDSIITDNDFNIIDTVYIDDINILINNNYENNDKFTKLKNLKYLYLEAKIDLNLLNNSKLIDNFNFDKLIIFNLAPYKKNSSIINTFSINKNKMFFVITNEKEFLIPNHITELHIINNIDVNLNNLPNSIEFLRLNIFNIDKLLLSNLPINLFKLIVNISTVNDNKNIENFKNNIKLPFGCSLEIVLSCFV